MTLPLLTTDEITSIIEGAWMRHGVCCLPGAHNLDTTPPELFRLQCDGCPVRGQCLSYGILTEASDLIYGGADAGERRQLDNGQRYSICTACAGGFVWNKQPRKPGPNVCPTCNSTIRTTHYSYGDAHA